MTIREQLTSDMKDAMRARDSVTLNTIRFLLSQIKNVEIDNGPQSDEQVQEIVRKQIKQMKDAIGDYERGGRTDLVTEENAKIAVLQKYLPQMMSHEDLVAVVEKVIADNPGANMGQIMGVVRAQVQGKADGGEIAAIVKEKLQT